MTERCEWWWSTSTALEPMNEAILVEEVDLMCVREEGHPGPHLLATSEEMNANYPTPLEGGIGDDEDFR